MNTQYIISIFLIISNIAFGQNTEYFNFKYYSVDYNYDYKCANNVSYRLTKEMVLDNTDGGDRRTRAFSSTSKTANSKDYRGSGYDRGHLFSDANSSHDPDYAYESMFYVNIAPQTPKINRGIWKYLEVYERDLAVVHGCITVRIDVYFGDKNMKRVKIPDYFIKKIETCSGDELGEFRIENIK